MAKNPNAVDIHVGQRLKQRRKQLGLSQTALGDAVGLTFQQIQKYEKGTNRISSSRLQQFAHILKVVAPFFFEGAQGQGKPPSGPESADYVSQFTELPDARRLMKAFMQIEDRELRRRIARVVECLAEREPRASRRSRPAA